MILVGTTGGRCCASAIFTRRPSSATSSSPWRSTSTTAPANRIRRLSRTLFSLLSCFSLGLPAIGRTVEPDMDLTGADRVFVFTVQLARRPQFAIAERRRHHDVVTEIGFRLELQEI